MKNLAVTMTIKANSVNESESIAMRELMSLAKIVAMHKGAMMACGSGNATELPNGNYLVEANVSIDTSNDVTEIIKETQMIWNNNANIISSMILVMEEKKPEPAKEPEPERKECDSCGDMCDVIDMTIINPGTESEMILCDACTTNAELLEDIARCEFCDSIIHVDNLAMNPVTKEYDLCPCCGNKLGE